MSDDQALNDHTRRLLQAAYEELAERGKKPDAQHVYQRARMLDIQLRDAEVERWMEMTLERVPAGRLRYLFPKVVDLLCEQCLFSGGAPDEDDDPAAFVAAGLATLRWRFQEVAGRTPVFDCTVSRVEAWLADEVMPPPKVRGQLSLFA